MRGESCILLLDTLSPKTSGTLNRNKGRKMKVNIDSGKYLREYNWGVTTNYLSYIYNSTCGNHKAGM